jgi:hypothetical protein
MTRFGNVLHRLGALPVRGAPSAVLMMQELKDLGWHRSIAQRQSVGSSGEATPWWTYPATSWLELVLASHPSCSAFEFGSGASTTWLAARTSALVSVEHDQSWHRIISESVGTTVDLRLIPKTSRATEADHQAAYIHPLHEGSYDLVIVDGLYRNACARAAIGSLTEGGLLLLDDSDRAAYAEAHRVLSQEGFGRVDFFGPRPGVGHFSTTSLFSRHFDRLVKDLSAPVVSGY